MLYIQAGKKPPNSFDVGSWKEPIEVFGPFVRCKGDKYPYRMCSLKHVNNTTHPMGFNEKGKMADFLLLAIVHVPNRLVLLFLRFL